MLYPTYSGLIFCRLLIFVFIFVQFCVCVRVCVQQRYILVIHFIIYVSYSG